MKLFWKRPVDERVAAETNKTYKIGFYVFTVGILADIILSVARGNAFNWFEWSVFMAAQIVCVVINARKGIADQCTESSGDKFPLKRVLGTACLVGVGTGVVTCVIYVLRGEWYALAPLQIALAAWMTFLFMFAITTAAIVALQAVVFVAAKTRSKRILGEADEDSDE
ncbi:DUF6773 family protein [Agathobaculum sp.]|uniref:DUF6773 family protein n=1 Tax=Agathobaculum sp. TaxID=2048138 RepID=UPI002A82C3CA|nr:DUF6773 family protein [Agathobaculum sp.]MDY3617491.1 DUF6773 family protein [Agathobaculum sp.]